MSCQNLPQALDAYLTARRELKSQEAQLSALLNGRTWDKLEAEIAAFWKKRWRAGLAGVAAPLVVFVAFLTIFSLSGFIIQSIIHTATTKYLPWFIAILPALAITIIVVLHSGNSGGAARR